MNIDWLSAVGMLLAGLIVGVMFVYSMRRREDKPGRDLELRDLEAKRDTLLAALRSEESPEERAKLERQAANVLRQIDELTKGKKPRKGAAGAAAPEVAASAVAAPATSHGSAIKGFAWGVGSVLVLVGIFYFVNNQAKPKTEGEGMGGAMSQSPQAQQQGQPQQTDAALQSLEQAVNKTPNDLNLRIELAKAYLDRENMMATYEQTQYILERQPKDARALTYQAIVRIAMGQVDSAHAMLDTATKTDPDLIDGWVALAWADTISGKDDEAQAALDEAAKHHPDQKQRLDALLVRMREEQKAAAARLPKNHPAVAAPGSEGAAQAQMAQPVAAAAPAAGGSVHVTLQLAAGVKAPPSGVIYLMARPEGQTSGPPLAVKRVPLGAFPITLDFGAADSMMGQPLPAKMHLEARVDTDGNAMTRDPGAPVGSQDGVATGASVTLTLK